MRYIYIGVGAILLVILVIVGGHFISSSSQVLPTPTPTVAQPSERALKDVTEVMTYGTAQDKDNVRKAFPANSDEESMYQYALFLDQHPARLLMVETETEKVKAGLNNQAPVVVNQPIQMPQYNPPAMVSAPRPVTCHTFYNGDVSCY